MIDRTLIDIVVADDHELVRSAIVAHLVGTGRMRCVGEAGTGEEAIELITQLAPAVTLVDIGLPDRDGFDVTRVVTGLGIPTRILLVSSRISSELVQRGFDSGADGYLSKVSSVELLPDAVDAVLSGVRYVDPEVANGFPATSVPKLDADERRVLEHLVAGRGDAAIAFELQLAVEVVAAQVDALVAKLGCDSRAATIDHAVRFGLVE
jgi:DNA-binding NarL/FixJ family response regulator